MTLDQLQEVEKYVSLSETPIGDALETRKQRLTDLTLHL